MSHCNRCLCAIVGSVSQGQFVCCHPHLLGMTDWSPLLFAPSGTGLGNGLGNLVEISRTYSSIFRRGVFCLPWPASPDRFSRSGAARSLVRYIGIVLQTDRSAGHVSRYIVAHRKRRHPTGSPFATRKDPRQTQKHRLDLQWCRLQTFSKYRHLGNACVDRAGLERYPTDTPVPVLLPRQTQCPIDLGVEARPTTPKGHQRQQSVQRRAVHSMQKPPKLPIAKACGYLTICKMLCKPGVLRRQVHHVLYQYTYDGAKGLEVSLCSFFQDHLVQREIGLILLSE